MSDAALRAESSSQYRLFFEAAPCPAWILREGTRRIIDLNRAAVEVYGYAREEFLRMTLDDLAPEPERARQRAFWRRARRGRVAGRCRHVTKGGRLLELYVQASRLRRQRASRLADVACLAWIGADRRAGDATGAQAVIDRYRRLSDHDRAVREEERARIARELHDQLGQNLSAFKMDLAWLSALADRHEPSTARAAVAGMMDRVDTAIGIVRRIAGDLRPGVLDRLGLVAAIEWQAAEFERRTGVRCQVRCQGECPAFDRAQSTEIFRIVQETLANVSLHARAASVKVTMTCTPDRVALRVSDNGRGIPQEAIESDQSLGLVGMRERATILGGTLTLSRGARRGTEALLVIPHSPSLVGQAVDVRTTER